MRPSFNTTGPCVVGEHYMLPPERRLGRIRELIDEGKYFTLQAGRQTGKTTSAQWLAGHYNAGDRYRALWLDIQTAREQPDPAVALRTVLTNLDLTVERQLPDLGVPASRARLLEDPETAVLRYLQDLASRAGRPLVVLIDEADGLVGPAMVSFLTQLREGYIARSQAPFPHSVALIGTASPFNVTAEVASLEAFTRDEVLALLAQHTAATGQRFEPEAAALVHELSQGHPWLANALADRIVERDLRDRSVDVTAAHVEAAKEAIIVERRTHVDSLMARLREPRVRRILDPMLAGTRLPADVLDDDVAYVVGMGLLRVVGGEYAIANPIYREIIPRALTHVQQRGLHQPTEWYVGPDGLLDMPRLLAAFQVFWREDGHLAAEGFDYRESGPHLMLMAFLQRIVNGGGRIEREYGLGRGALDLMVAWRGQRHAIEVKLRRDTQTQKRALEQVTRYLDRLGLDEGWLVTFDLRGKRSWKERLTSKTVKTSGKRVHLIGC